MPFSENEIQAETERLHEKLRKLGWSKQDCEVIAPMTLEISRLKKEKGAVILAHSYQTPDIKYGVADFVGDSYDLSMKAAESDAATIVFCSVEFMGETAKIMSPGKTVLVPKKAGCSLAESITPDDIRKLKAQNPKAPVVCYVNTTAAVKAECDACCTSGNAAKIINAMEGDEVIFIPDKYMAKNLEEETEKKIIPWDGICIVHEEFTPEKIKAIREDNPDIEILAHPECAPEVIELVDFVGGTAKMLKYMGESSNTKFLLVTECGLSDRARVEYVDKEIIGTCTICPYMKEIMLKDVLQALEDPLPEQIIEIPEETIKKARKTLDRMVEIAEGN